MLALPFDSYVVIGVYTILLEKIAQCEFRCCALAAGIDGLAAEVFNRLYGIAALNDIDNLKVAIEETVKSGALASGTISYTTSPFTPPSVLL